MIRTLQSLRFIFVLMVFMSHFAYQGSGFSAFDAGGDCGVAFFFMLSGFVLSLRYGSQIREGTFCYGRFMGRRLRKIYPLHLLCLLFFLVVSRSGFDLATLLNVALLQSWVPDPYYYFSCNSVSWFLSSLLVCYVLFPFAYRRLSAGLTLVVFSAYLLTYLMVPTDQVNAILYVHPLVRFVDFYIGMLLGRFYEQGYRVPHAGWLEWLLAVCLVITLAVYPWMDVKFRNAPLYWMVLIPLILVFAKGEGRLSSWLCTSPMQLLASLSMAFYMIHQMMIGILIHRLPEIPGVLMLFVCILTTLSVSWLIERFLLPKIEKVI